jgi:hypothetical protein
MTSIQLVASRIWMTAKRHCRMQWVWTGSVTLHGSLQKSPANQAYHYKRNAETCMLLGDASGRGMVTLLTSQTK